LAASVVFDDAMLIGNSKSIAALALKNGLCSCGLLDYAAAGGLMAYGVDFPTCSVVRQPIAARSQDQRTPRR